MIVKTPLAKMMELVLTELMTTFVRVSMDSRGGIVRPVSCEVINISIIRGKRISLAGWHRLQYFNKNTKPLTG